MRVLVHTDYSTPLVCVNVMYDVGSRDESPKRTGFAHLFEHLMFGGSVNISSYDGVVENAGGENNAFTSNDVTNYYLTLPASALETAFWLESDRMLGLALTEKGLKVQKGVVVEEFRQRYLNQPYGDVWLHLRPLVYEKHPYAWPTIGKSPAHIEVTTMQEVKDFFDRHYHPANAVLSIAGNISSEKVFYLAEKWFGGIEVRKKSPRVLAQELPQKSTRFQELLSEVPSPAIYSVYKMPGRTHSSFCAADLLSDILSAGNSSRLFQKLVKKEAVFSELSTYLTGDLDPGLFVFAGKLSEGVRMEHAEKAVNDQIRLLQDTRVEERELQKVKNKLESVMAFGELSLSEKALNLAYYEIAGGADMYNQLRENYLAVGIKDIQEIAQNLLKPECASTLYIIPKQDNEA